MKKCLLKITLFICVLFVSSGAFAVDADLRIYNHTTSSGSVFLARNDNFCLGPAPTKHAINDILLPNNWAEWRHTSSIHCGVEGELQITMIKDNVKYLLKVDYSIPAIGKNTFKYINDRVFGIRAAFDVAFENVAGHTYEFEVYAIDPSEVCDGPTARVAMAQKFTDRNITNFLGSMRSDIHSSNGQQQFGNGFFVDGAQDACVYYGCKVGKAYGVWGDIWRKYHASDLNAEHGRLGWPITDELATPVKQGAFCHFQGGSIYWSKATGSHIIWGPIKDKWEVKGWENSKLGFPKSDEKGLPGNAGLYQEFENGRIYYGWGTSEAYVIYGNIMGEYSRLKCEQGILGFPTSDCLEVTNMPGCTIQHFLNGHIYNKKGAHYILNGPNWDAYVSQKCEQGKLGFPTGDPYKDPDGTLCQKFEGGKIEDRRIIYN